MMLKKMVLLVILALVVSISMPINAANLAVNALFTNNAVLQRNMTVPVFGTATDGTLVTVTFNGQSLQSVASGGKWQVNLAAMAANTAPGNMIISDGTTNITLTGLQVGEVWVCSGQSNMVKNLSSVTEGPETAADAPNHNIKLFQEPSGGGPAGVVWTAADNTTAGAFSAVGYFFAHHLVHNMNPLVPIGMIQAATVGTTIQEWCHFNGAAGGCYDTQVKPLQPYAMRGVLWYQGESNSGDSFYADYLTALISEWRTDWNEGQFPFMIIQLHGSVNWAPFREQQLQVWLSVPNTGMPVAIDLPPTGSMHPVTKRPIGDRLGLFARYMCYGETSLVYSGPLRDPVNSYVQGNQVVIAFNHVGGGLTTGSEYQPGGAPYPFAVTSGNGSWYAATAQIVGNTIVVSSASVPYPVAVRYIWDIDKGNLYNTNGLPASPFEMIPGGSPPGGGPSMHIFDVWTCNSSGSPVTVFTAGSAVYWRVKIVDATGAAVSGATVTTDMRKPDGSIYTTIAQTTGADGVAIFNKTTRRSDPKGGWSVRVTGVTKYGYAYDQPANVKTQCDFTLQ